MEKSRLEIVMENVPNGKQTQSLGKVTPKATRAVHSLTLLEKLYTNTRMIDLAVDRLALYMGNLSEQHVTALKEFLC